MSNAVQDKLIEWGFDLTDEIPASLIQKAMEQVQEDAAEEADELMFGKVS